MAVFHLNRKDLVVPTKKQGAPRGKNQTAILRYTEHLKTVKESGEWPFPPILVLAMTKKDKKSGEDKPTGKWSVIGGGQRVAAANNVNWANPIPAEIFDGKESPDDRWASSAYVAAVRDNMKHGQPFTEGERIESFRYMRELGLTMEEIAHEWHVHKSTVSKDLRGLTTVAAREANAAKNRENGEEATEKKTPAKGKNDVIHFLDFLKARYDEVFEYLSAENEAAKEYREIVFRLAEALNA